jgi:type IV pilus assembly protein PilC
LLTGILAADCQGIVSQNKDYLKFTTPNAYLRYTGFIPILLETARASEVLMPTFTYRVRDATGKIILSTMEADTSKTVRDKLREKNLTIVSITEPKSGLNQDLQLPGFLNEENQTPGLKPVAIFARQMATMIDAGLPLVQSLNILARQSEHKGMKKILKDIRTNVESGLPFSDALVKYPKVFDRLFINLVRAGEVSGTLDTVLDRVAVFKEKDLALRGKIRGALTYPTIVLVFALGVTYFLLTTIVPQFAKMIKDINPTADLPPLTRFLDAVSQFLQNQTLLLAAIIAVVFFAFRYYYRTENGRRVLDRVKMKAPVFGNLISKASLASFSRTLSLLIKSGVNIIESLDIVRGTSNNAIVEDALTNAKNAVIQGEQMSQPMNAAVDVFPPMVVSMVAIGEETGGLDTMLDKVAEYYEREVDEAVDQLTAAIEPIMIIFLGFIVGLIVAGMFLPMFALIDELAK